MKAIPKLIIIVPCYNEEDVLPSSSKLLSDELELLMTKNKITTESKILFVNNNSTDSTWDIIKDLADSDGRFIGMSQSRNRGHQSSLLAGLMEAKEMGDITITIDCDGQDDISVMEDMVDKYMDGCEIVYGVRSQRKTDTFFKRVTAEGFYKLLNAMGVETIFNHADYRLVSKRVLDELEEFKEVNLFLRGMFPLVGFPSDCVYYERHERMAGKSHYPLADMLGLAIEGITSLSVKPLRLITTLGIVIACISFFGCIWALIAGVLGTNAPGWASMTAIICFVGGIQLVGIGILGEYIGKIYLEVKHRPRYIISERTWDNDET